MVTKPNAQKLRLTRAVLIKYLVLQRYGIKRQLARKTYYFVENSVHAPYVPYVLMSKNTSIYGKTRKKLRS